MRGSKDKEARQRRGESKRNGARSDKERQVGGRQTGGGRHPHQEQGLRCLVGLLGEL